MSTLGADPVSATAAADPALLRDDALVAAFEGPGFTPGSFHHRHHLRLAWAYLERRPLPEVLTLASERARRRFVLPDLGCPRA